MTIPVVGALSLLQLTQARFRGRGNKRSIAEARQLRSKMGFLTFPPTWVGPRSFSESLTRFDNLSSFLPKGYLKAFHMKARAERKAKKAKKVKEALKRKRGRAKSNAHGW